MKLILLLAFLTGTAFATPAEMKLASPTKIKKMGRKINLEFMLPCLKTSVLDSARIVITNDDSGDAAAAVGLVYSQSERECGQSFIPKKFNLTIDPKVYGYSPLDTIGGFEKMDLAK